MPIVIAETVSAVRAGVAAAKASGRSVALVPTMGALHAGHLALVAKARTLAETVVVSIFVNPLQFGPAEDLAKYPRTLDADVAQLNALDVDLLFAPAVTEMYPDGRSETRVTAGAAGDLLEGTTRPGHFDGVLTVVAKLLNIVQPDVIVFGQKDAQQVFLVKRMVRELNFPVRVEVVATVREESGLALSSRNRYLDAEEGNAANALSQALAAADAASGDGIRAARKAAAAILDREPLVVVDYVAFVHPTTFLPVDESHHGATIVLIAAKVGSTRLIDNAAITLG